VSLQAAARFRVARRSGVGCLAQVQPHAHRDERRVAPVLHGFADALLLPFAIAYESETSVPVHQIGLGIEHHVSASDHLTHASSEQHHESDGPIADTLALGRRMDAQLGPA